MCVSQTSISPNAIDDEIPEEDHPNGSRFSDVIAEWLSKVGENEGVDANNNDVVDNQADDIDENELGKLRSFFAGARLGKGPQPIPGEIAENSHTY